MVSYSKKKQWHASAETENWNIIIRKSQSQISHGQITGINSITISAVTTKIDFNWSKSLRKWKWTWWFTKSL